MKLLVIGDGRHGKDTVCKLMHIGHDMTFRSSSDFANERAVFPFLKGKYNYTSAAECYNDRINHREEWKDLIRQYNGDDPGRLVRELLEDSDIYCGLRHREEFEASKHLFDFILWIDASDRLPPEKSNDLTVLDADLVIDNNGNLYDLRRSIDSTMDAIFRMV